MSYMSRLTNRDKLILTLDIKGLEDVSIEINLAIPPDLYNDNGEIVTKIPTYIQASDVIKITKTNIHSSSGL